jgi:hypothetical protein
MCIRYRTDGDDGNGNGNGAGNGNGNGNDVCDGDSDYSTRSTWTSRLATSKSASKPPQT